MRAPCLVLVAGVLCGSTGCALDAQEPAGGKEAVGIGEAPLGADAPGSSVDFAGCTEYVGLTPVPLAHAAPLVPPEFTILGANSGEATLAFRAVDCEGVSVNGRAARPGQLVQIGISIESPDGTGDTNNSLLWFMTDHALLFAALRRAGVPAQHVRHLSYEYEPTDSGGATGTLEVVAPQPARPRLTLSGLLIDPPPDAPAIPFLASWYSVGKRAVVQMRTDFPELFFGGGEATLTTPATSDLAALLGAPTTGFPILSFRAIIPSAHMEVIVTAL